MSLTGVLYLALGLVFVNGCLFLLLSITGVREKILAAIPSPMKIAISAGIGLFIAFIGLENGGLIVANQATLVSMTPAIISATTCGWPQRAATAPTIRQKTKMTASWRKN